MGVSDILLMHLAEDEMFPGLLTKNTFRPYKDAEGVYACCYINC
jgi:hypothetical protein